MKTNTTILILLMFVSCCIVSTYAGAPPSDDGTYNVDYEYISDGSAHATELTPAILKEMQGWSVMTPGTVIHFPDPSGLIWSGKFYIITSDGLGFEELPISSIRGYGDDCPFSAINKTEINKQIAISPLKSTRYSEFLGQKTIVSSVSAFEIPGFCNNLPAGTQMDGESFRESQSVTDGFRLALAGIGFPSDAAGSLEMTDEILEQVKSDENFADLIETGFVLKLEKGDERRYYEIFPGGTGYQEIVPSLSSQVALDNSSLKDLAPAFCNNIPEGTKILSGTLKAANQNISTKSPMITHYVQTTESISFGKLNGQYITPIGLQQQEAVAYSVQRGINPPGYFSQGGSSTKWNSNTAWVANIRSRYR